MQNVSRQEHRTHFFSQDYRVATARQGNRRACLIAGALGVCEICLCETAVIVMLFFIESSEERKERVYLNARQRRQWDLLARRSLEDAVTKTSHYICSQRLCG